MIVISTEAQRNGEIYINRFSPAEHRVVLGRPINFATIARIHQRGRHSRACGNHGVLSEANLKALV